VAEAAKRRFNGEAGAEEALRVFWVGYSDSLVATVYSLLCLGLDLICRQRIGDAGNDIELAVLKRAVRSVPGSGEVWARYIRLLVRPILNCLCHHFNVLFPGTLQRFGGYFAHRFG